MRITQPGIGVRVNIVGDGRWRHRARVEIALHQIRDHLALECVGHSVDTALIEQLAGDRVHHHADAFTRGNVGKPLNAFTPGRQRESNAAALIGLRNLDRTARKIRIDNRIEQHVAIDKTGAHPRDDPIELQLDTQSFRERSPDLDLKSRSVRFIAGVRERVRIGTQRNGAPCLYFCQRARGCGCREYERG